MTSRKKVVFVAVASVAMAAALAGWAALTLRSQAGPRDSLVGWFKITGDDRTIPVFKSDGTYYSICLGWEVPLTVCPEGLESSGHDTTIGFDKTANTHFIKIVDEQRYHASGGLLPLAEKRPMTKVAKPSWFRGPKAQRPARRPRTNDHFLGWYDYVWWPRAKIEIRKEGEEYLGALGYIDESGVWTILEGPTELAPLPDQLGFTMHRGDVSVVYDKSRKRFELIGNVERDSTALTAPLTRISHSPSGKGDAAPLSVAFGLPSKL